MTEKKSYKDTLNLPKTEFSMKANLSQREPEILKKWDKEGIYKKIVEGRSGSDKRFILHDGPPYANGNIHVGHALNKTLKDICVKYFSMKGYYSPYVPGWDCHGLPVEHQLFKELKMTKNDIDQVEFREKAYKYAMRFVKIQADEFKRLGVFGDWENPYLTLTNDYEADILDALADLYEKGYVYKGSKPVNWCKECETALAEAEVEYEDKLSPSIFVRFPTKEQVEGKPVFFTVWTTTPWTLIANVAVAVHPDFMYSFVETGGEIWILAEDLVETIMQKVGVEDYKTVKSSSGTEIVNKIKNAYHPFIDRTSVVVTADYVTKEEGTGCVHTAPGHGQDDHVTGKKYDLPVIMPVDNTGKFTKEAGEFEGKDIIEANDRIIEKMRMQGKLIHSSEVEHSYPHCWRCKEPIIFRATEQWFINIDHNGLRNKLGKTIDDDVTWSPASGQERIGSMIKNRPDWCLSRQRYWGVPIPAFKCKSCGHGFTNASVIRDVADFIREESASVWFKKEVSDFLPDGTECSECKGKQFIKENDILDVWFDSGVSYKAVLEARKELGFPADLYLEGSDQHRGWFQSALITSVASNGRAPYKEVLTHGFVVDGEGKKMSKSSGNVIRPQEIMKTYGADVLRLWVASNDYESDIKLSSEILERLADGYRKIRNTFRFLLSNLYDFDPDKDALDIDGLFEIDKWMLSQLSHLAGRITSHYDKWEFHKVYRAVYDFCVYEVSSFYLDVLKDTLYILRADSQERRSHQTVIFKIFHILVRLLAPIMPFTTEEAWANVDFNEKKESVHLADWPGIAEDTNAWSDAKLDQKWETMLSIRDRIMKRLEIKREEGLIGSSLEASIFIAPKDDQMSGFIDKNIGLFPALFKVSRVQAVCIDEEGMDELPGEDVMIKIERADGDKCLRCWNYSMTVGESKDFPDLCQRCYNIMSERSTKNAK